MENKKIESLIQLFEKSQLTVLEIEDNKGRVRLERQLTNPVINMNHSIPQSIQTVESEPQGALIESPLVGIFYAASAEGKPAYVKVGDSVKSGDILCVIEAMKTMNEIRSDREGVIAEILVKNGDSIEYHQPLFRIA